MQIIYSGLKKKETSKKKIKKLINIENNIIRILAIKQCKFFFQKFIINNNL